MTVGWAFCFLYSTFLQASNLSGEVNLGQFRVQWSDQVDSAPWLRVSHSDDPEFTVWQSVPAQGFVEAAVGQAHFKMGLGSFDVNEREIRHYSHQKLNDVSEFQGRLIMEGVLSDQIEEGRDFDPQHSIAYRLTLFTESEQELAFELELVTHKNDYLNPDEYRIFLKYQSNRDEHFFGFGEQFSYFDLKGKKVPILVQEQGVGRGLQPLTSVTNLISSYSGGNSTSSYAPVPHYMTSQRHSVFLENYEYSIFDLTHKDEVKIELFGKKMKGRILFGLDLLSLLSTYTKYSGRMRPLPHWIDQGAIVAVQGGNQTVYNALNTVKNAKIPVSAFWIQDWVGSRKNIFGSFLKWAWNLDRTLYPDWDRMVGILKNNGIRVLTYINPFLDLPDGESGFLNSDYDEALKQGFFVETPHRSPLSLNFIFKKSSLVDLFKPEVRSWMKDLIRSRLLSSGVSGWMSDFGEAYPIYSSQASSDHHFVDPEQSQLSGNHNRYPEVWAQLQKEVIEEEGLGDEIVWFSRSGFTQSPGKVRLFWLGDQLTSWDGFDGIKTALIGLLSSGLSGFSLNHSDIGGYTAAALKVLGVPWGYRRTRELFMRWAEMNAFTAMFRTHEGNNPQVNHQFNSDPATLAHFRRFAKIFQALGPYRRVLMAEAYDRGYPLVRPLVLHYPQDSKVYSMTTEFLMGRDFLVAPVLDPGVARRQVYFPEGNWIGLFSGERIEAGIQGIQKQVEAPIGSPAVYFLENSDQGHALAQRIKDDVFNY